MGKPEVQHRYRAALYGCAATLLLLANEPLRAQAPPTETAAPPAETPVTATDFQPVRIRKSAPPDYPEDARADQQEGWVNLQFMVSPQGVPYEAYVVNAVGSKAFERAALEAIRHYQFQPAVLGGQPIDSAVTVKMRFALSGGQFGARSEFIHAYQLLARAIARNDRAAADAAMAGLHVTNLYEDAYYGLAQYSYAVKWGEEDGQIAGLQRAIAEETKAEYLPKPLFGKALLALLPLEIHAHDFAAAMDHWQTLQQTHADPVQLAALRPTIEQITALRTDGQGYSVAGHLEEASWWYPLYKSRFYLTVSDGHVTDLKLLCERRYVSIAFDPALDYRVSAQSGRCSIVVEGDSGTHFQLIQH